MIGMIYLNSNRNLRLYDRLTKCKAIQALYNLNLERVHRQSDPKLVSLMHIFFFLRRSSSKGMNERIQWKIDSLSWKHRYYLLIYEIVKNLSRIESRQNHLIIRFPFDHFFNGIRPTRFCFCRIAWKYDRVRTRSVKIRNDNSYTW